MKITVIPLDQLKPNERNVRIHPDKQIREYMRSLEMFEQVRPIVVDEDYVILIGNGMYEALRRLGRTEAECEIKTGLTRNQKSKLMLADNRIYKLGLDDTDAFEAIVAELGADNDIPGYDEELLKVLVTANEQADQLFTGYGIITDEHREQFQRAAENYRQDEAAFEQDSERIMPVGTGEPLQPPFQPTQGETKGGYEVKMAAPKGAAETPTAPIELPRKYIICPKCGERIWV